MASGAERDGWTELAARRVRALTAARLEGNRSTEGATIRQAPAGEGDLGDEEFGDEEFAEEGFAEEGFGEEDFGEASPPLTSRRGGSPPRRFGRRQVLVVAVLLAVGVLVAGWAVLRARPVALAQPRPVSATPGQATGQATGQPVPGASGPGETTDSGTGSDPGSATRSPSAAGTALQGGPSLEVHVLGAVHHPGVVRLRIGARVADALSAVGGTTGGARLGQLNLAQPLGDGQQLFVAARGDPGRSELRAPAPAAAPEGGSGSGSTSSGTGVGTGATGGATTAGPRVDLNTATETDLDALPGIGPVTAGKIIAWRTAHGRFSTVQELQEVDGIGPKTFADLAPLVTVG